MQAETPGAGQTLAENITQIIGPYPAVTLQFSPATDDVFVTAAPSPLGELQLPPNTVLQNKPAKKKRKYVRKKGLMSDVVGAGETGDEESREAKAQGLGEEEIIQEAEAQAKPKKPKPTSGRADGEKKNGDEAEKQNRPQGPTSAKERIEAQLREALKEGSYKVFDCVIGSRGLMVVQEKCQTIVETVELLRHQHGGGSL